MKLPLVGASYALLNPAAACQATINLYPEVFDDPDEQGKNKWHLVNCPGYRKLANVATAIYGTWSGGGRLFVIGASGGNKHLFEVADGGSVISDQVLPGAPDDGLPAQIFGNGNQLGIVANGYFYYDNGAGPFQARFSILRTDLVIDGADATKCTDPSIPFDATDVGMTLIVTGGVNWTLQTVTINAVVAGVATCSAALGTTSATGGQAREQDLTAAGLVTAITGAYLDSAMYIQRPAKGTPDLGRQVNFSAVNDFTLWQALNFFTKESQADYLQAVTSDRGQLYLWGTESSEVWQNDLNGNITRIPGAEAKIGTPLRYGQCSTGLKVYFMGGGTQGQGRFYRLDGFTPVRVSTQDEEIAWIENNSIQDVTSLICYSYLEAGHTFVVVSDRVSPSKVYDETASELAGRAIWHTRGIYLPSLTGPIGSFGPYLPNFHTFIPEWDDATPPTGMDSRGRHIVASTTDGNIYVQSIEFHDDAGFDKGYQRILAHLYTGTKRQYLGRLDLECATGTVAAGKPAPSIYLDYSKDRGNTFINPRAASLGVSNDFSRRVFWTKNGAARDWVPRLTTSGQFPVDWIDAELPDYMVGTT